MQLKLFTFRNILLALVLVMIVTTGLLFINKNKVEAETKASKPITKPALTVTTVKPQLAQWDVNVKLQGEVFPWQEAMVSSEISGLRIVKLYADVGQQVKRGQTLVRLADETIVAALTMQKAVVAREKAALSEAMANAERARNIQHTGALSKQKVNQYLIAEQMAKANLALAEAELQNQKIRSKQTVIFAPDDGVITTRTAKLGDVVTSSTALFTLMRKNRIEWRAEVNSKLVQQLQINQIVTAELQGKKPIQGKVRLIAPTVNNQSRNALAYVDLPENSVKPGTYLIGHVAVAAQEAVTLPQSAITFKDGTAYLFQTMQQNKTNTGKRSIKKIKVALGRSQQDKIEVLTKIDLNAEYVARGGAFLNDGDTVTIVKARAL